MPSPAPALKQGRILDREEDDMKVIADLSIVPLGVGVSLSGYVALCERVLAAAGLEPQLHANGTNVEGEWEVVFTALKHCHEELHARGVPRVATNLRLGTRSDRDQTLADKVRSVEEKLRG
jgi:uncharacterized protein (TIGR00106 family)